MSPEQVRALANDRGGAMRHYGITVDFAPVLDLDLGSPIVGDRSYSSNPEVVAAYATAWAQGLHDGGVIPVLKHFPGHGSARGLAQGPGGHRRLGRAAQPRCSGLRGGAKEPGRPWS